MARKRMISPNIWEDPSFNKLSITARLAFIGMISNADDEGFLRGDLGSLKRLVFGFDLIIEDLNWYDDIKKYKNLHFYEVDGEVYVHLLNWDKYQVQQRERIQKTLYPKCITCLADAKQMLTEESKLSKESKLSSREELRKNINSIIKKKTI